MNLLEAKNLVFRFFQEKDTIVLPKDLTKILAAGEEIIISDDPDMHAEVIKLALKSFEDANLIKSFEMCTSEGKSGKSKRNIYVLEKPLQSLSQTIELNGETCFYIAKTLNSVRDKDDKNQTNPMGISANDIEDLLVLAGTLIKNHQDNLQNQEIVE